MSLFTTVGGAAMWGLGNVAMRKARPADAFGFMVWMSLVPPLPLLLLSAIFEGMTRARIVMAQALFAQPADPAHLLISTPCTDTSALPLAKPTADCF